MGDVSSMSSSSYPSMQQQPFKKSSEALSMVTQYNNDSNSSTNDCYDKTGSSSSFHGSSSYQSQQNTSGYIDLKDSCKPILEMKNAIMKSQQHQQNYSSDRQHHHEPVSSSDSISKPHVGYNDGTNQLDSNHNNLSMAPHSHISSSSQDHLRNTIANSSDYDYYSSQHAHQKDIHQQQRSHHSSMYSQHHVRQQSASPSSSQLQQHHHQQQRSISPYDNKMGGSSSQPMQQQHYQGVTGGGKQLHQATHELKPRGYHSTSSMGIGVSAIQRSTGVQIKQEE